MPKRERSDYYLQFAADTLAVGIGTRPDQANLAVNFDMEIFAAFTGSRTILSSTNNVFSMKLIGSGGQVKINVAFAGNNFTYGLLVPINEPCKVAFQVTDSGASRLAIDDLYEDRQFGPGSIGTTQVSVGGGFIGFLSDLYIGDLAQRGESFWYFDDNGPVIEDILWTDDLSLTLGAGQWVIPGEEPVHEGYMNRTWPYNREDYFNDLESDYNDASEQYNDATWVGESVPPKHWNTEM